MFTVSHCTLDTSNHEQRDSDEGGVGGGFLPSPAKLARLELKTEPVGAGEQQGLAGLGTMSGGTVKVEVKQEMSPVVGLPAVGGGSSNNR